MRRGRSMTRRAFTLLELLVVIVIFAIVVAIAVPSFNGLLYTSNQSRAANALQAALLTARDAAIQSSAGRDGAAVFFFEPGGRMTVVACVSVGVLRDRDPSDPVGFPDDAFVEREVFVPVTGFEASQLPVGWLVRAYTAPGSLHDSGTNESGWYDDADGADSPIYQGTLDGVNWILPETGFYGREAPNAGRSRQTFMIRFEGGTGRQNVTETGAVLVLDPARRTEALLASLPASMRNYRADQATDPARFVRSVLAARPPGGIGGGGSAAGQPLRLGQKAEILGDESVDTVLARPVGQLALYNVRRLASRIGLRGINEQTGCLYRAIEDDELDDPEVHAEWDESLFGSLSDDEVKLRMYEWLEDRYYDGPSLDPDARTPSDARIFGLRRYDGGFVELTGSKVVN